MNKVIGHIRFNYRKKKLGGTTNYNTLNSEGVTYYYTSS